MRVALAADHGGAALKDELAPRLVEAGHEVVDLGGDGSDPNDDYPDFARMAGEAVRSGRVERAIVVCGSGVGAAIAANKLRGIRAGLAHDTYSAHQGVQHDDMNVLCLGARVVGLALALELATTFLAARYSGEERHRRRIAKVEAIEEAERGPSPAEIGALPAEGAPAAEGATGGPVAGTVRAARGRSSMTSRIKAAGSRSSAADDPAITFLGGPPPRIAALLDDAMREAQRSRWVERIWRRDASLWSPDEAVGEAIGARLGWLRAPEAFDDTIEELEAFAAAARDVFRGAVLAGMGGSSLAPALLARTFAPAERGMPLEVLDSTDPAAVTAIERDHPPAETLYLIATKSGATTETLAFLAYFLDRVEAALAPTHAGPVDRVVEAAHPGPERWVGDHFAAITDPGESVERIPYSARFREVFLNPPDVGGRYSALTYVGLVPGALLGLDLRAILASAVGMAGRCRAPEADRNPGLALGLLMGGLARAGIDKLTLVLDPRIAALGPWIEQLVAESTGKRGTGIVPVDGEALGAPEAYDADRLFVAVRLEDGAAGPADMDAGTASDSDDGLVRLAQAGHPVVMVRLPALAALGGEFFRWEFATAVAGAVLGVNPFDEPNVTESKRNTERVLRERPLPDPGIPARDRSLADRLAGHLERLPERGYIAIGAFVAPSAERDAALGRMRLALRDATRRATTVGYGPRYLHSTGQLHKGGPPKGRFLQLVAGHPDDLPVPGRGYTFGTLIDAQADGDLAALEAHGLPTLRVHLGDDPDEGLAALQSALGRALGAASARKAPRKASPPGAAA